MKRALLLAFIGLLCWASMPAFSQNRYSLSLFYRSTREEAIIQAFNLMDNAQAEQALSQIIRKPMRVIFKDMRELGKDFKDYDALNWISAQGQQIIFINEKHRTAPPEALAALIAHEALHADEYNSMHEEIAGWQEEGRVWHRMKQNNPSLQNLETGKHPLVDRLNRIEAEYYQGTLASFVRQRPGYTSLPEHSPGFGPASKISQEW